MKRIAFVNQRYGIEVNGGSEYYTRLIAEHLKDQFAVEILTTKAIDYVTWDNHYPRDEEEINGVLVRRFPVEKTRNMDYFGKVNAKTLSKDKRTRKEEQTWVDEQGPFCPQLVHYIREQKEEYDLFIFVTYLYYTTCMGMREVFEKSVLIPTAHDEPYIYFDIYRDIFQKCKAIVYLTEEEKQFVQRMFHNEETAHVVTAVGIDLPPQIEQSTSQQIQSPYITYVGRIDEGKGCDRLFQYFMEYKKRNQNDLKLVLMGKNVIPIPKHPDIIYRGFVSEEEKFEGITNADALILPSQFESLSISVLEALQVKTPVVVNGNCAVLKGHCIKSDAGLYYTDYYEWEGCLNYLLAHEDERRQMGENGKQYVDSYYRWDIVTKTLGQLFEQCTTTP